MHEEHRHDAESDFEADGSHRRNFPALPFEDIRGRLAETVRTNKSTVVVGPTGSGKTVGTPDMLLETFPDAKIFITEPRRAATRSVARYLAKVRGSNIGDEIGFLARMDEELSKESRAIFMTDGILLRKLQHDPLLLEADIVMVDEAHERSLNIDFTLGLLKRAQRMREEQGERPLKVIVASATIEKEKFGAYLENAPDVEIEGRMFPITTTYEPEAIRDYPAVAATRASEMLDLTPDGHILIFMPGEAEIRRTIDALEKLHVTADIFALTGSMTSEAQDEALAKSDRRKIIVATNVAETSLTIPGVTCVIDSGLINEKRYNPETGIESLETVPHAQSGLAQRTGRAGREFPGLCHRLFTEQDARAREAFQTPELKRSDLAHVVLQMKHMGINDVEGFEFPDPPSRRAITEALKRLKTLGALDENERITPLGEQMSEFPLSPERAKMLIDAHAHGCAESVATILALTSDKPMYVFPDDEVERAQARRAHDAFKEDGSDFLAQLAIWKEWQDSGKNKSWAKQHYVSARRLFDAGEVRTQLLQILRAQKIPGIDEAPATEKKKRITKSLIAGHPHGLLFRSGRFDFAYANPSHEANRYESVYIHPGSAVFGEFPPSYMIGADIKKTVKDDREKIYARMCHPVTAEEILEVMPHLFAKTRTVAEMDVEGNWCDAHTYTMRGNAFVTVTTRTPITDPARIEAEKARRAQLFAPRDEFDEGDRSSFWPDTPLRAERVEDPERRLAREGATQVLRALEPLIVRATQNPREFSLIPSGEDLRLHRVESAKHTIASRYFGAIEIRHAVSSLEEWRAFMHEREVARERLLPKCTELSARVAELAKKVGQLTEESAPHYGLSVKQLRSIGERWRRVLGLIATENSLGQPIMPDPENAGIILDELAVELGNLVEIDPEVRAREAKILSEEDRRGLVTEIQNWREILHAIRELPNPPMVTGNERRVERMKAIRAKDGELRRDASAFLVELEKSDNKEWARGKSGEIGRRIEAVAKEAGRVLSLPEDWSRRFREYTIRGKEIMHDLGAEMDDALVRKVATKLLALACADTPPPDPDTAIEEIIIDLV